MVSGPDGSVAWPVKVTGWPVITVVALGVSQVADLVPVGRFVCERHLAVPLDDLRLRERAHG